MGDMRDRRLSSFSASFFTSSGMPAASIFLLQLFDVALAFVLLAQFLLDGLHLLAQVVLALRLLHVVLHFGLDLVAKLLDFQLLGQMLVDLLQAHAHVGVSSRSCLSVVESNGSEEAMKSTRRPGSSIFIAMVDSSSDRVGEPATICWNSVRTLRCKASISAFFGGTISGTVSTVARMNGVSWVNSVQLYALQALGEDKQALVGHVHNFVHHGQRADGVQIGGLRRIHPRLALGDDHDGFVLAQRLNQLDRAFPAYGQGQNSVREEHRIAHGQDGKGPVPLDFVRGFLSALGLRLACHVAP